MSKTKVPSLLCPSEMVTEAQRETDRNLLAFDRTIAHLNRRGFLGAFFAAAATASLAGGHSAYAQTSAIPPVVDVLNFALNLEYLEANFYLYVSTGSGLPSSSSGAAGVTPMNPPGKLTLDPTTMAIASALAQDEVNHITLLRSTITQLSGIPIDQPLIDYAAKGAITTQAQFLASARQFTALGNSAYVGSAQLLVSNPTVLTTAAQILGAEGQHAGALNYQCDYQGVASPLIDAQDVTPATSVFTLDPAMSLSPSRNTMQVLGVAYGVSTATTTTPPAAVTMGGFFPNGVNGNVKST